MTTTWKKFHYKFILINGRDVDATRVSKRRFQYLKSQKEGSGQETQKHGRKHAQNEANFLSPGENDNEIQAWGSLSETLRLFQDIWTLHYYHPCAAWHSWCWWNSAQNWIWFCARNHLSRSRCNSLILWLWENALRLPESWSPVHKDMKLACIYYSQLPLGNKGAKDFPELHPGTRQNDLLFRHFCNHTKRPSEQPQVLSYSSFGFT